MRTELTPALRARSGKLVLRLVEIPLRVTAGEAHRGPVAQDLPALLAQPVGGLPHSPTVARRLKSDGQSSR